VGMTADELTQIVVAEGPGSYTGVRIGVTTAKSLAWALKIPVITVSSLQLLSYNGQFFKGLICPFFDARRQNVYTGLYEWTNNKAKEIKKDTHTSMSEWLEELAKLDKDILFLSPDIDDYKPLIIEKMGSKAIIPNKTSHFISPRFLYDASLNKEEADLHALTPNYIRLVEAEVNWLKEQ